MDTMETVTKALGGLALFVYGMGLMSDGLKEIAGAKLKTALGYMTRNSFFAILTGLCVTAIIQSSSATSVMTVGFVNAGLLSLTQAIGVIFGANMGTTVTGQIVSLKLGDLAIPALVIGVAGTMIAKRKTAKGALRTVLGFGFLFFGMTMMGSELKALTKYREFVDFFSLFDCTPGQSGFLPFGNVLGAILAGTVCTMAVQSSSATIGITIALAEAGVINIWTAVPIVLGDNMGTTITAALAAIGTNVNARRTALAHALFNVLGTVLLVATFAIVFTGPSGVSAPAFFHLVDASAEGDAFGGANPGRHIAMAHTLFNVTNVAVLAAFIPALARLCERLIRAKEDSRVRLLEPKLLLAPSLALEASISALADMTRRAWTIASVAMSKSIGKTSIDPDSIESAEKEVDGMREEIKSYLVKISQQKLSQEEADMIPDILHCANDAERISDLALKVYRKSDLARGALEGTGSLSEVSRAVSKVRQFAHSTIDALRSGRGPDSDPAAISAGIKAAARKCTRELWDNPRSRSEHTQAFLAVVSVLKCLRDISRHLANIASRAKALHPAMGI